MRIPLNGSPLVFKVDAEHAAYAGLPEGMYLIRMGEFGVSLSWKLKEADTWLPPALATDVTA